MTTDTPPSQKGDNQQSRSMRAFPLDAMALFSMAAVIVVTIGWYVTSVHQLNQFHFNDDQLWGLIASGAISSATSDESKEQNLQKKIFDGEHQPKDLGDVAWKQELNEKRKLAQLQENSAQFQKAEVTLADAISSQSNHDVQSASISNDSPELASDWAHLAHCAYANGEISKAQTAAEKALSIMGKSSTVNQNDKRIALTTLGEIEIKKNKLDDAGNTYELLVESCQKTLPPMPLLEAKALARQGDIAYYRNHLKNAGDKYSQALTAFNSLLNTATKSGDRSSWELSKYPIRCMYASARVNESKGKWTDACILLERACNTVSQQKSQGAFIIALKKEYAYCLWRLNPVRAFYATVDAIDALDAWNEGEGKNK